MTAPSTERNDERGRHVGRNRSATIVHAGSALWGIDGTTARQPDLSGSGHPLSHSEKRHRKHTVSGKDHSHAHSHAHLRAGHTQPHGQAGPSSPTKATAAEDDSTPRLGHKRTASLPSPPLAGDISSITQTFSPTEKSPSDADHPLHKAFFSNATSVNLSLYTYTPTATSIPPPQPSATSLLPAPAANLSYSRILVSYASLPWHVKPGDYLEIRGVKNNSNLPPAGGRGAPITNEKPGEADALEGVKPNRGRDGYIFRLGEDHPSVPMNQIQVPNSVAQAFKLQHRQDVEIVRIHEPESANVDFIELHFSQYVGRADMWRLGMSLENTTVHVGEKVMLAGGAVRADVQAIWRGRNRYASGIVTSKTKTIFRSKSTQAYIFIQLCQETWEFDEDGERYYEKVLHGFLPDLFSRWTRFGASHLVTIILFGRVYYDDQDYAYMEKHSLLGGLIKDSRGRHCKDFFHVVMDFERKADWMTALGDIKMRMERSEREVLLDFHVAELKAKGLCPEAQGDINILGRWSFAYEGNVLEAINLALNPFDEHYIDRDLSRTGLSLTILTPGTGHFAVDKNLLRLTTERMIDHGIGLDLVCLTKMPLHSVPLFSYVSERPKRHVEESALGGKTRPATPDPLYFDASLTKDDDKELIDCYSLAFWVYCSFYSKTHDKPFRGDRFVPRCKMYQIQMLGILDHNLTTISVPFLEVDDYDPPRRQITADERKSRHDDYDLNTFGGAPILPVIKDVIPASPHASNRSGLSSSLGTSYQSMRLLAHKMEDDKRSRSTAASPRPIPSRSSLRSHHSIVEEESMSNPSNPSLPETGVLGSGSGGLADMPIVMVKPAPLPSTERRSSGSMGTPQSRILSLTSIVTSPSHSVVSGGDLPSGASTPKVTPAKRLKSQSSKGSFFGTRFPSSWIFGGARSQPAHPTASIESAARQDVSAVPRPNSKPSSPMIKTATGLASPATLSLPVPVPGAPSPPSSPTKPKAVPKLRPAQPMPIMSVAGRRYDDEPLAAQSLPRSMPRSIPRSLHNSLKPKSMDDSWRNKTSAAFGRTAQHTTVNPCNPKDLLIEVGGEGGHQRRWQHVRPRVGEGKEHVVKWRSLCAPACLPLTTDFMPTTEELNTFYESHSYDIACFPDQVSFLIRPDAAHLNLPLAVMREMASQRLSQNFQFIVLPHNTIQSEDTGPALAQKNFLLSDATTSGLRVGGASEVLKDAEGAIYLSWSNHVHKLTFDPQKQSVTVQRFVRKIKHSTKPHRYTCLVWPYQLSGFQEAEATFKYPNIDAKLNFNYLDRLIAGEEENLQSNLRFWRTRYLLIPSGRDPTSLAGIMPRSAHGEHYSPAEVLMTGAQRVLELMCKHQWRKPGQPHRALILLPTTFDPSACVLDEGLMTELERLTSGKEKIERGHTLEGLTLQQVADMMNRPNNGLIIRDRWWNFNIHEDSFTGEQFSEWLKTTFTDVATQEQAIDWAQSLLDKGVIEHVTKSHTFHDNLFFYRLAPNYDETVKQSSTMSKGNAKSGGGWFSKATGPTPQTVMEHALSTSPTARHTPLKLTEKPPKKRKIKMSQSVVIDLDPSRKSDRAEVAILHADIVHNTKNAFHFELNWLGVTAGLLDELRNKCSALAERYGLRFVEAPVEQIKDVGQNCAYRAPIPIKLAIPPPIIPDLHLRLTETSGSGQCAQFFEYAILMQKFGFVLDVEATERYPDALDVEYAYRQKAKFEYSQFIHRSGLALVQCVGPSDGMGFLWCDNRPFISAPTRARGQSQSAESHSGSVTPMSNRQEQARQLREELEAFCEDPVALQKFYEEVTPRPNYSNVHLLDTDSWAGGSDSD